MTTETRRITRRAALAGMAGATMAAAAVVSLPTIAEAHPDAALLRIVRDLANVRTAWYEALYHRALKETHLGDSQTARSLNQ